MTDSLRELADRNARRPADTHLRDEFAMAALTGLLSNPDIRSEGLQQKLGDSCYRIADAMMEARGR
jgi:hypothetical protein